MRNEIKETMFEQELRGLESFGKLFSCGIPDNAWPGKSDQCSRFADIDVAEHCERGSGPAGGWVGGQGNIGYFCFAELGELHACLCKLHQRKCRFHHSCATTF